MVASRGIYGPRGQGCIRPDGYVVVANKFQHIVVAEKVLGRKLPDKAEVHHVNEDKSDNRHSNLVICPNREYHQLLHKRMRALENSGNPNWKKCKRCLKWDDPLNLRKYAKEYVHRECNRLSSLKYRNKS